MIRFLSIVVLLLFMTGCVSALNSLSGSGSDRATASSRFTEGLHKLETTGDPSALKKLSADEPESVWGENSRSVLTIHSAQQKTINSLKKKNGVLRKENEKLKDNLDKLNKINLEMEKRSP